MDSVEVVAAVRKILAVEAPVVQVANPDGLLAYAGALSPEYKLRLLAAMGFESHRPTHSINCASIQGSGLICTCARPQTRWLAPEDVVAFMHETVAERRAETDERMRREDEDPEDAEKLIETLDK